MKTSFSRLVVAALATVALASFAMTDIAEAARGGGGGGAGARAGGGGGARQSAQVNNSRADARTNDVRSTSVNSVERNVVVVEGNRGGWDHPVAAAAVVGATVAVTAAAVGSMVVTVPPNCVPVNYGGIVYQQCGTTWYAPQGSQYVVVNPPY
jgi:hypothetical protein